MKKATKGWLKERGISKADKDIGSIAYEVEAIGSTDYGDGKYVWLDKYVNGGAGQVLDQEYPEFVKFIQRNEKRKFGVSLYMGGRCVFAKVNIGVEAVESALKAAARYLNAANYPEIAYKSITPRQRSRTPLVDKAQTRAHRMSKESRDRLKREGYNFNKY